MCHWLCQCLPCEWQHNIKSHWQSQWHTEEINYMSSTITTRFEQRFGKSRELATRAQQRFPSGVTHDGRYLEPFPVFIDHAAGSTKFSVEGHPIIDYWVGHGSLLLGHSHPAVVKAVQEQMTKGTHFSAGHEL